jgi:hypothetical protein
MPTYTFNGEPLAFGPFTTGEGDAALTHPAENLALWSDDELAALGIVRLADVLPVVRQEIPKHIVQDRLHALGKLDACFAVIQSNAALFGEWFVHGPNVYADDAQFIQVLQSIGCTAAEIAQVTA